MKRKMLSSILVLVAFCLILPFGASQAQAAKKKTYTITTSAKPYKNAYIKNKAYNKYTQHYYVIRSYMEQLEKEGGGTLVLKKGTYNITNAISIPSNVKIILNDGVTINKTSKTGVKQLKASNTLFQLVAPKKQTAKNSYSGYKGASNISIVGKGKVTINLGKTGSTGIFIGHNNKVQIQNITFKSQTNKGYIMQILGSSNITIQKCSFLGVNKTANAILFDIPVKGLSQSRVWMKNDNTVCQNILIENSTFKNLNRGIVTTKFLKNKYVKNIKINKNKFNLIKDDAIRALNWDKPSITNNVFDTIGTMKSLRRAIYFTGVKNPTVTGNNYTNVARTVQIDRIKNSEKKLSKEGTTVNTVTSAQLKNMVNKNKFSKLGEYYIRNYKKYNSSDCTLTYYPDSKRNYTIKPTSGCYRNYFTNNTYYNKYTKQYFAFRSIMDQLERNGGGTLTVKAGTYVIPKEIPVPSNVTIYFEDGVVIKKGNNTGNSKYPVSTGIFSLVAPSVYESSKTYSGYNGVHDVSFVGPEKGKAIIDMDYKGGIGIVMAHNKNIKIQNMTFQNMYGGHYIELDASYNVVIENNTFRNHKDSSGNYKEAINIDTPDKATLGFIRNWTSYDKTPNTNVYIRSNTFYNLERAIGTHAYSPNKWHKNIQIINNKIDRCDNDAIVMMNWDSPVIRDNRITNINGFTTTSKARGIMLKGVKHPKISNNYFSNVARMIEINVGKMDKGTATAVSYPPIYNVITEEEMQVILEQNKVGALRTHTIYEVNVLNPKPEDVIRWYLK